MQPLTDIVIIGGGPAGLSAGIYAGRASYKTIMIEKLGTGGQLQLIHEIENYPGFPDGISGFELQDRMTKQAQKFGMEILSDTVESINIKENIFFIQCADKTFTSYAVIIASGAKYKLLGVPGEIELTGKGVSYCAVCDGFFFRDKNVVVVGGGDTALTEALYLTKFAKNVTLVHRRDRFRAVQTLVDRVNNNPNIKTIFESAIKKINGASTVESVSIENVNTGKIEEYKTDGVFVFVGLSPNTGFIQKELLAPDGYVITDSQMKTALPGIFAAGDVRSNAFRQVVTACSDGATASEFAGKYIDELKGTAYH